MAKAVGIGGAVAGCLVGFVPASDPRLCVLVVMDEPQGNIYGGQVAAPVFREIVRDALGILGVYPDERLLARGKGHLSQAGAAQTVH